MMFVNILLLRGIVINPLTHMSDQDSISLHYINIVSSRQVMRIKKNINYGITN